MGGRPDYRAKSVRFVRGLGSCRLGRSCQLFRLAKLDRRFDPTPSSSVRLLNLSDPDGIDEIGDREGRVKRDDRLRRTPVPLRSETDVRRSRFKSSTAEPEESKDAAATGRGCVGSAFAHGEHGTTGLIRADRPEFRRRTGEESGVSAQARAVGQVDRSQIRLGDRRIVPLPTAGNHLHEVQRRVHRLAADRNPIVLGDVRLIDHTVEAVNKRILIFDDSRFVVAVVEVGAGVGGQFDFQLDGAVSSAGNGVELSGVFADAVVPNLVGSAVGGKRQILL